MRSPFHKAMQWFLPGNLRRAPSRRVPPRPPRWRPSLEGLEDRALPSVTPLPVAPPAPVAHAGSHVVEVRHADRIDHTEPKADNHGSRDVHQADPTPGKADDAGGKVELRQGKVDSPVSKDAHKAEPKDTRADSPDKSPDKVGSKDAKSDGKQSEPNDKKESQPDSKDGKGTEPTDKGDSSGKDNKDSSPSTEVTDKVFSSYSGL
jgi:hypothetical protein